MHRCLFKIPLKNEYSHADQSTYITDTFRTLASKGCKVYPKAT